MSLRVDMIERMALQKKLDEIGRMRLDAGEMELFSGSQSYRSHRRTRFAR